MIFRTLQFLGCASAASAQADGAALGALKLLPKDAARHPARIEARDGAPAVEGVEALAIATEWKEFANQDLAEVKAKMHTALVFDGRNLFDPATMKELGFTYYAIGRPVVK